MKGINRFVSFSFLIGVTLSMGIVTQSALANHVEGHLIVAGETVQLQHAYAHAEPGFFDKTKEDIVVMVTNIPLSDKLIKDWGEQNELVREGTLKFVEVTINAKQRPISVSVKHAAFKACPSGFTTDYILEAVTFDENTVEGRMYCKTEQDFFDTVYTFDFTFKVEIQREKKLPPPTKAEKETASKSPQAALYREFVEAANAGDVEALKQVLMADTALALDGPDKEDMLAFMKLGNPPEVAFQRILVEGDSSTLILSAQDEGKKLEGKVEFIMENNQWKLKIINW